MTSAELRRAKERYDAAAWKARTGTAQRVQAAAPHLPVFTIGRWSNRAESAYKTQWLTPIRECDWNWPEIFTAHREIDRLDFVIWGPNNRLSGLGLATTRAKAIVARFFEGDPSPSCALRPMRMAIFMDAVADYGQRLGKAEIHAYPVNEKLAEILLKLGFRLESPRKQEPYYAREI